jgi:hypothetical protein
MGAADPDPGRTASSPSVSVPLLDNVMGGTMKFVLHWETRPGAGGRSNLADIQDLLTIFGNWDGFGEAVQTTEWVVSLTDTGTGWLVCTTDDADELMSQIAKFTPWLTFTLTPVQDVQRGAELAGESAGWVGRQLGD